MKPKELLKEISISLMKMDVPKVEKLTKMAIESGLTAQQILDDGLVPAMQEMGRKFGDGEIFLPELLMAGEAMKTAMKLLEPLLIKQVGGRRYRGKAVIGTVQGDVHDIGKNIVVMMLKGNGWDVTDLGVDVAPEIFVQAVRDNNYQVVGLSALLTTTMPAQRKTIEALKAAGLRDKVKVAIGGAVCTEQWADQIGADCFATDASEAVRKLHLLLQYPVIC